MEDNEKVVIISNSASRVGIDLPHINFKRQWPSKGSKVSVSREIFDEMMYDNGARYFFENGMLYTENLDALKAAGLEDEDAVEPVKTAPLTDAKKKRLMTVMPAHQFKEEIKALSREQVESLADYAIENKILDYEKCNLIKERTGRNVMKAVELSE